MAHYRNLKLCISSLSRVLINPILLKNQLGAIERFLRILKSDCEKKSEWYDRNPKICFLLSKVLRKLIRYVSTTLVIEGTERRDLMLLKKGTVILQVNAIRNTVTTLWSEMQNVVLTTSLSARLARKLMTSTNGEILTMGLMSDFNDVIKLFHEVFTALVREFRGLEIQEMASKCLVKIMPSDAKSKCPKYELFEDDLFSTTASSFADYLLSLDPRHERARLLSTENLAELIVEEQIREGGFGTVFVGSLDIHSIGLNTLCIQEVPRESLDVLTTMGKLVLSAELCRSVNDSYSMLMKVHGFTIYKNKLCVAMEKVGNTLRDLLHAEDDSMMAPRKALENAKILSTISAMAKAADHLHYRGIIHGDIRPENVFITANDNQNQARITLANFNYGLNTTEPQWQSIYEGGFEYHAPEVLSSGTFTAASDVYSLSICLWEMSQINRFPFDHFPNKDELAMAIKNGERPQFSPHSRETKWLVQLAEKSWVSEPWNRPTAGKWSDFFDKVVKQRGLKVDQILSELAGEIKHRSIGRIPSIRPAHKMASLYDLSIGSFYSRNDDNASVASDTRSRASMKSLPVGKGSYRNPVDRIRQYEESKSRSSSSRSQGFDGREMLEKELREFFLEVDESRLSQLDQILDYIEANNLKMFNDQLVREYKRGLPRFGDTRSSLEKTSNPTLKKVKSKNALNMKTLARVGRKKQKSKKKKKTDYSVTIEPLRHTIGTVAPPGEQPIAPMPFTPAPRSTQGSKSRVMISRNGKTIKRNTSPPGLHRSY